MFIVKDFTAVHRKVRLMAALNGGNILSGDVLDGKQGIKTQYKRGLDLPAAIYLTDTFKREEPGLTLIARDACSKGWQAVPMDGLKNRGRKPSLLLHGRKETVPGLNGAKGVLRFTGSKFVSWLASKCLKAEGSSRVKAHV